MQGVAAEIVLIVVGLALVAVSRWLADNFKIPGEHKGAAGTMIRMAGLYDNYPSSLYRWISAVLTGTIFVAVGVIDLFIG